MKLYGFNATRSVRPLWVLRELDAEFQFVPVNLLAGEQRRPEFLRLNPAGKVPVLVDGDIVLTESVAISLYLAEKYPAKRLLPGSPEERAQAYRWIMFAASDLEHPLWRITRHTSLYPEEKRLPADAALARDEFLKSVTVLNDHMEGRLFIVGDHVTVADCITAHALDWANELHLLEQFPRLRVYLERMYARPKAPQRIAEALASLHTGT